MSKAPEFVRINRPTLDGEGIFPESDEVFCPIALTDTELDKSVRRVVEYRGYICKQHDPNFFWTVFASADGSELPLELQGHFTSHITLKAAINKHLAAKEQVKA